MINTRHAGDEAETRALTFLKRQGLSLIERNYHCRRGEIDLIMLDTNCLVFVEVRMRNNKFYGSGADTVTRSKMRKIATTAQHYLTTHTIEGNLDCRFDVISIDEDIDWFQNAFTLDFMG